MTVEYEPPFSDPRCLVGLHADVGNMALPYAKRIQPDVVYNFVLSAVQIAEEFSKSSREAIGGHDRKGHAKLFRTAEWMQTVLRDRSHLAAKSLHADNRWASRENPQRRACSGVLIDLVQLCVTSVRDAMQRGQCFTYSAGHDLYNDLIKVFGVDGTAIVDREAYWRFKDASNRKHHGRDIQNAFKAAWGAKQYKLAYELIGRKLPAYP